jgi:hypothetical protein
VRLARRFGRFGFLIGFLGPVLFYASPISSLTFESHFLCPWCPYVDWFHPTSTTRIGTGLGFALFSGLVLAAVAFAIGYAVSKAIHVTIRCYGDRPG